MLLQYGAGGVGAASNAPFLARFVYGNQVHLTVFDDAGPDEISEGHNLSGNKVRLKGE